MAKINTLNYQTVASWNGSQDLFVVEQPDGTKVATPAMVKQYVLDGVTETSEQYAECSTARNVAAKTVTLPGFKLEAGARISVRFTDTGSSNPASGHITLNVNGTGAKEIVDGHTNMTILGYTSGGLFYNNLVDDFVYDGTYWVYMNRDNNTTYSSKTAASGGTATSLCTTGEKYTWNNKQNALTFDNVPTQNSNNPVKSGGIKSSIDDKAKRLNNIKIIDENFEIRFIGYSDVANRILCPIIFPFAFASNDYTLECSLLDLASVGRFTTGISVNGKDRSSALIILSKTSSAGAVYCGVASIHISRTE